MNKEIEFVKCNKCGYDKNIKGSKKCIKCLKFLDSNKISCPKCAKINVSDVKKCVNCGFDFGKKDFSHLISLLISTFVVVVFAILVYLDNSFILNNMKWIIRIVGIVGILIILVSTLCYGKKQRIIISAEEQMNDKKFKKMKLVSNLSVILGIVVVLLIVIYIVFTK